MPFAALKGYEEALRAKEKVIVEKSELTEERKEELSRIMSRIKKKDLITVVYYHKGEYLEKKGIVSKIDADSRILGIVDENIRFDDIYDLRQE